MRLFARALAVVVTASLIGGCSKQLRDVLEKRRPQVEPMLGKLPAIRAHAIATPPLSADATIHLGAEHRAGVTPSDLALVYLEDLADPKELGDVPIRIPAVTPATETNVLARCASVLETHREPFDPRMQFGGEPDPMPWYTAEGVLTACAAVRYVFVIKTVAYAEPSSPRPGAPGCPERAATTAQNGSAAPSTSATPKASDATVSLPSANPCQVYDSGFVRADVLVYEALTARHLGGFRVTAESRPATDLGGVADRPKYLRSSLAAAFMESYSTAANFAVQP